MSPVWTSARPLTWCLKILVAKLGRDGFGEKKAQGTPYSGPPRPVGKKGKKF